MNGNTSEDLYNLYVGDTYWCTARGLDLEDDTLYYKFSILGPDNATKDFGDGYHLDHQLPWIPRSLDIGKNKIFMMIIDKKHQNESGCDDITSCNCSISPRISSNNESTIPKDGTYPIGERKIFELYPYENRIRDLEKQLNHALSIIFTPTRKKQYDRDDHIVSPIEDKGKQIVFSPVKIMEPIVMDGEKPDGSQNEPVVAPSISDEDINVKNIIINDIKTAFFPANPESTSKILINSIPNI